MGSENESENVGAKMGAVTDWWICNQCREVSGAGGPCITGAGRTMPVRCPHGCKDGPHNDIANWKHYGASNDLTLVSLVSIVKINHIEGR